MLRTYVRMFALARHWTKPKATRERHAERVATTLTRGLAAITIAAKFNQGVEARGSGRDGPAWRSSGKSVRLRQATLAVADQRRLGGFTQMATVHDVAAYILQSKGAMSTWKLQKLVYYSQAWHLVWDEEPLFGEPIEAWANGPVVRSLYSQHRGQFNVSRLHLGDPDALTTSEQATVDGVLASYGGLTGRQLSHLTHAEGPWQHARAGLSPTDRSETEISHSSLAAFYSALDADNNAQPVESIDWESWDQADPH